MRVAALYDVHGNLPALEAVLRELDVDQIVFGGDLAAGPFPRETIELARTLSSTRFVSGNADRYIVEGFEGRREPGSITDEWVIGQLGAEELDFLRSFEPTVSLDGVLYCHATPHDDEQGFTRVSPDGRVRELLGDVAERTVVVGHTHMQFDRTVAGIRVVNAGSVGLPKDRPGAAWALLENGDVELRRTPYDLEAVARSPWAKTELFLREPNEEEWISFVEAQAAAG